MRANTHNAADLCCSGANHRHHVCIGPLVQVVEACSRTPIQLETRQFKKAVVVLSVAFRPLLSAAFSPSSSNLPSLQHSTTSTRAIYSAMSYALQPTSSRNQRWMPNPRQSNLQVPGPIDFRYQLRPSPYQESSYQDPGPTRPEIRVTASTMQQTLCATSCLEQSRLLARQPPIPRSLDPIDSGKPVAPPPTQRQPVETRPRLEHVLFQVYATWHPGTRHRQPDHRPTQLGWYDNFTREETYALFRELTVSHVGLRSQPGADWPEILHTFVSRVEKLLKHPIPIVDQRSADEALWRKKFASCYAVVFIATCQIALVHNCPEVVVNHYMTLFLLNFGCDKGPDHHLELRRIRRDTLQGIQMISELVGEYGDGAYKLPWWGEFARPYRDIRETNISRP